VTRGVRVGYRVIEEYMRQGQAFANSASGSGHARKQVAPDPQKLTERMFQYASDLASAWLDYAQISVAQTQSRPTHLSSNGSPTSHVTEPETGGRVRMAQDEVRAPDPEPFAISIDIASSRRAVVSIELKPGKVLGELLVHDLRSTAPDSPRVTGVVIELDASGGRSTIRLRVPDDQPAGTYAGLIVERTSNLPRGYLALTVLEATDRGVD
jgi:hypothetical protein